MGSMSADARSWPSPLEIQRLLEERSMEELEALAPEGVAGLCKRLGSDPQDGLPSSVPDRHKRVEVYGENALAEKTMKGYLHYVWEALHDKIILLLLAIGTLELVMEMSFHPQERSKAWIEPTAIYITVIIIVNVQSSMDYSRERLFDSLSKRVAASNLRYVIRSGQQESLRDDEIVVGDILAFNAHMAASIPADGLLISGDGVKMDESALTGETEPVSKDAEVPFMFGGTTVTSGQGRMLVLAVGEESVAGRIRKAVYDDDEGEPSPLFEKLDRMANAIGRLGTCAAVVVFLALCIQGFAIHREPADQAIEYLLLALGVLAVAVPEGLPLALTISLAISSNRMSYHNNLVKTLDSCETMGSVTTICTDKTGTLTANRMTVEACYIAGVLFPAEGGGAAPVGERVRGDSRLGTEVKGLVNSLICVCTMDESSVTPAEEAGGEPKYSGNPTECAMLRFSEQCGFRYQDVRRDTAGRSEGTRDDGVVNAFSSSRKMMSWAVPHGSSGGYRIYVKGASEAIMARSSSALGPGGEVSALTDAERQHLQTDVLSPFASSAFRTIGLAFADLPGAPDDSLHNKVTNLDGSPALACETELTLVGVLGIADPLRPEVPGAIKRCYTAGIDVRMVTGDNLDTAVAIARKAGILDEKRDFDGAGELKMYRAMEGKKFRQHVHRQTQDGERIFLQDKFDEIWPYLRVLARSSPEDKLTLARGLGGSSLYQNADLVHYLKWHDSINVFPDRQVVAMTGDGTNDAPALKAADVGFAMGNAGTQIAKDAADIILLDDNFASIVTAANWGRNVFDSVQKFLQFQLTVNISIVTISLITAFAGVAPPLTLLHLLWVNLIMDSLASIALASEPPTEKQLQRPPVNRSQFIISEQMWYNMLGQAAYQVVVILVILGMRNIVPGCGGGTGPGSEHYTIIFNTFVLMQLFNEYNSRFLRGEWNIFQGLLRNPVFLAVSFITFTLQVLMTQFGSTVLHLHPGGLTGTQWLFCLAVGAGPLLWQPVINLIRRGTLAVSRWMHRRSRAELQRRRARSRTGAGLASRHSRSMATTYHGRSFGGGQTSRFQAQRSSGVDMLV